MGAELGGSKFTFFLYYYYLPLSFPPQAPAWVKLSNRFFVPWLTSKKSIELVLFLAGCCRGSSAIDVTFKSLLPNYIFIVPLQTVAQSRLFLVAFIGIPRMLRRRIILSSSSFLTSCQLKVSTRRASEGERAHYLCLCLPRLRRALKDHTLRKSC